MPNPHTLKLEAADLRVLQLPLKFKFETSFGVQSERIPPLHSSCAGGHLEARKIHDVAQSFGAPV